MRVTNKKEWDQFCRSACTKAFPISLASVYQTNKGDLFEKWLEGNKDWGQAELLVQRSASNTNLNRKQWQAVKGRTLKEDYGEEKARKLMELRRSSGLWYADEDFPDDTEEAWYYMSVGHKVRQDNETRESMKIQGQVACDSSMLTALTADGSALAKGALPEGLMRHAVETEKIYHMLAKATSGVGDEAWYQKTFSTLDEKHAWFVKAKAAAEAIFAGIKKAEKKEQKEKNAGEGGNKKRKRGGAEPESSENALRDAEACLFAALVLGGNQERDLQRWLKNLVNLEPYEIQLAGLLKAAGGTFFTISIWVLAVTFLLQCYGRYFWKVGIKITGTLRLYLPRRRLTVANLNTWGHEEYAELGSKFKAAHDHLLCVLATCCWSLANATGVLDRASLLLLEEEAVSASDCLFSFLRAYQYLALHYRERKVLVFKLRPKHHYVWHTAWQIRLYRVNQRLFHTWDDESFLGKLKYIARCCHGLTMSRRVFSRYLLAFGVFLGAGNRAKGASPL
ncbi:unnamed protein product [Effrenium voratum]|uniref:Uncharacterized protein n=1 Tax=Effrenium voratum TaxID=2562239 RepID=A0AA36J4Z3_9DINO|nr:unnamed protein product [Effrenium voratum]